MIDKRQVYTLVADRLNYIKMSGTEVVDIGVGSEINRHYLGGCVCSTRGDDRYDKETGKIICPYKDSCCNGVLKKLSSDCEESAHESSTIDLIHKDVAEENQFLKRQNEEIVKSAEALDESLETLKKESQKEINKWQSRFYSLQYNVVKEKIEGWNV